MKIRRIRLQNIKSYTDQEISFHDGVNFISGINGAGKSTLIEAIGYALFDYKPGSHSEFVRYGAKSGAITIEFCANDDREYRIVRKINATSSNSSWNVFDLESGGELDLHGVNDVKGWLKEVLGVDRDIELDQLFQDIVGVPQGTFVGPFLETPSIRKKKFDNILRVEQYREAYLYTKTASGFLRERIKDRNHALDLLTERVKDYDTVKTEMAGLSRQIAELAAKLEVLEKSVKDKEQEVKAVEEIRAKLDETENRLKILHVKGATLKEKLAELKAARQKAEEAADAVKQAENGYRDYLRLEEEIGKLDNRRQEKEALEKKLNQAKQEIARIEAEAAARAESLKRQKDELDTGREDLVRQVKELEVLKAEAARDLDATKERTAGLDRWKFAEEAVNRLNQQLGQMLRDVESREEQLAVAGKEEAELCERLKQLPALRVEAERYDELEKVLQEARRQYDVLKAAQNTLEKNLEQSKGGLCPFLNSPCRNVQGDLESYFTTQIEKTKHEILQAEKQGRDLRKQFEKARNAREQMIMLGKDETRLNQVREQKKRITDEIRQFLTKAAAFPVADLLDQLKTASAADFPRFDEACAAARDISAEIGQPAAKAAADRAIACLDSVLEESAKHRAGHEKLLLKELDERSGRLSRLDTEHKNALKNLEQIAEKEQWIQKEKQALEKMTADAGKLKDGAGVTEERLAEYKGLADEIRRVKTRQEACRRDYEAYIQNRPEAGRLDPLRSDVVRVEEEVEANTAQALLLQTEAGKLKRNFDKEQYEQKKRELDLLKQEAAREKQVLVERRYDLQERDTRLKEMDRVRTEMEGLRQELAADGKTLGLLEMVRGILNNAGPPVARVYLENLSREANDLYRQISRENVALEWREGYDIVLVDNYNGKKRERTFKQFSGGEQMTAALAVRLALLKQQSRVRVGFFDEPTANLDSERRVNLAETIPQVTGGFNQIFIISHDDTFDSMTDNIIHLQKDDGNGSQLIE